MFACFEGTLEVEKFYMTTTFLREPNEKTVIKVWQSAHLNGYDSVHLTE